MGTDSTELTFIRCPSCKSLVPAASPRCRMCGSALEASKKSSESEDAGQKKNNFQRARQHTINVNAEERAKLEEDSAIPSKPKAVAAKPEPEPDPEFDIDATDLGDPLGAFLEEVAVEAEQKFNAEETEDFTEEDDDFASENGNHDEPEEEPAVFEPQPKVKKTFVQNRDLGATIKPRQPARGGLSFSKPKHVEPEIFPEEPEEEFEASSIQEEDIFAEEPVARQPEVSQPAISKTVPPVDLAALKPAVTEELKGRLIGWMVSYKDPKGTATELREGKFFLSRSSLKGSDLIIDDESISTPHALFGITSAGGVRIQDLMSDRGVFIRKKGNGEAYQRMLESIKLEHGDWIRFGDVEFQIAIL